MGKKLGPLTLTQWAIIGAAIGFFVLIRNRSSGGSAQPQTIDPSTLAALQGVPNQASNTTNLGPTDPTTGLPYAFEFLQGQGSSGQQGGIASLEQELNDLANINSQLQGLGFGGLATSSATSSKTGQSTQPALHGKGAILAPRGPKKPKAPKGFKSVGLGSGWWEFLPIVGNSSSSKGDGKGKKDTGPDTKGDK